MRCNWSVSQWKSGRRYSQGSQSEHETQGNSFPTAQIQPLQLKNWKKHDREVLKYTKSCPSIDQSLGIDALSDNFSIPYGAHGDTLEGDDEEEGGAVTDHENHEYLTNKSESLAGEYTEVEQEDGHFGEGLNDNIEKLHSIKDLGFRQSWGFESARGPLTLSKVMIFAGGTL